MFTRPLLLTIGWAGLLLGCSWSRTALAQGTTLLPPPSAQTPPPVSLPLQNPPAAQPQVVQQTGGNLPRGEVRSVVVARVNGEPILLEDQLATLALYREDYKRLGLRPEVFEHDEKFLRTRALEEIITREAILQDAGIKLPPEALKKFKQGMSQEFDKKVKKETQGLNLKTDEDRKGYFQKQGKSFDMMRNQFIRQNIAFEWIRTICRDRTDRETTREALLEYYRANPAEFQKKERVVWQHLFVDVDRYSSVAEARQQAEIAWRMLRNAKTDDEFSALVEKYADGISKARRGIGEGNFKGEVKPKDLEQFVFAQPTGGQGPVVETSRGFHVFRVTEHAPAETISFEKACNDIKKKLENKIFEEEFKRLSKEMRERAYIEMLNQE